MDVLALVGLTVAAAQIVKEFIEKITGNPISTSLGTVIAIVTAIVEVAVAAVKTGAPLDFALILVLAQVIIGAVGAFKVAMQVAKKIGLSLRQPVSPKA